MVVAEADVVRSPDGGPYPCRAGSGDLGTLPAANVRRALWVEDAGGAAHAVPRCVAGANEPARRFTSGTAARTLRRRRESARKALDLDSYEMLHLCWL